MSIPSAEQTPAYCQRLSTKEAEMQSKMETNRALTELGAKLQKEVSEAKNMKRNNNLTMLNEHVQLSELLNEYFDLDETSQKARMLEVLSEINKLRKINRELSASIDEINKKYEEEKEMREEADEQLRIYDEEMTDMKEEYTKQVQSIKNSFDEYCNDNKEILSIRNKEILELKKANKREWYKKTFYSYCLFALGTYTFYVNYL